MFEKITFEIRLSVCYLAGKLLQNFQIDPLAVFDVTSPVDWFLRKHNTNWVLRFSARGWHCSRIAFLSFNFSLSHAEKACHIKLKALSQAVSQFLLIFWRLGERMAERKLCHRSGLRSKNPSPFHRCWIALRFIYIDGRHRRNSLRLVVTNKAVVKEGNSLQPVRSAVARKSFHRFRKVFVLDVNLIVMSMERQWNKIHLNNLIPEVICIWWMSRCVDGVPKTGNILLSINANGPLPQWALSIFGCWGIRMSLPVLKCLRKRLPNTP